MHRIDTPTAENSNFVNGNANQGIKGTQVDAPWLNSVQEEIAKTIEDASMTLDKNDDNQLSSAVKALSVSTISTTNSYQQSVTPSTSRTPIGSLLSLKKGDVVDVTMTFNVSVTSDDIIALYKLNTTNQSQSIDLSIKGYQSLRWCFVMEEDYEGKIANLTFVNGASTTRVSVACNGLIFSKT